MLRAGELPALGDILGGGKGLPHAHFDDRMLSTLPSSTIAAWVTALTGVPPAEHGVAGNEFFIREQRRFAAPAPVSFDDSGPVVATYTDGYLNRLVTKPSVYEQMRARDPNILIWVAMHQLYSGADRLVLTRRSVMADAFEAYVEQLAGKAKREESRAVFEALDEEVINNVISELDEGPLPDVLTVYVSGSDLFAHVAEGGPDRAQREYLREVVDPLFGRLAHKLAERGGLENRYVVVTADHGHTEVSPDPPHALGAPDSDALPKLIRGAGFRLRPLTLDAKGNDDFQAVVAYGGALAYVYVADRSTCPRSGDVCDWNRPPRFRQDVLALADAIYRSNSSGTPEPALRGAIDLVLTRRPRPQPESDLPFGVYVGGRGLAPVPKYLRGHPHPTYVDLDARLRELAAGPLGERAGDILLIAHNGDREGSEQRYYFAAPYHSWHGSPSRADSEVPLIVAHPRESKESIAAVVGPALGGKPHQQRIADVLLALRFRIAAPQELSPPRASSSIAAPGGLDSLAPLQPDRLG
jgi:hypothetical protein